MGDLEYGPHHFVLLFAFVRCVFGVFHLVLELEEGVFDVFEAVWRRLLVACAGAVGWHVGWKEFWKSGVVVIIATGELVVKVGGLCRECCWL